MAGNIFGEINKTSLWQNKFGDPRVALYNEMLVNLQLVKQTWRSPQKIAKFNSMPNFLLIR